MLTDGLTLDTVTEQTSQNSRAGIKRPYVDLNGGATQVQLVFPGTLLEELRWAENSLERTVLRTLWNKHILLSSDGHGGYQSKVSLEAPVASLRGTQRSNDGYLWFAELQYDAYDPDNPQKRLLNNGQNNLSAGIVLLPNYISVGQRSKADRNGSLLGRKSFDFSLEESKGTQSDWISELNGKEGLLCDWYRIEEAVAAAYVNVDKLPPYKSRPKEKALLRGHLTLSLDLSQQPTTSPEGEDRSLQLTNPWWEKLSLQELEEYSNVLASASSGTTDTQ